MKVSLSTGCLYPYPLRVAFSWARELGFDGVEVAISPETVVRGAGWVRELSRRYDLPITALHPPLLAFPGWEDALDKVPAMLRMAQAMGAPLVILHAVRCRDLQAPQALKLRHALEAHGGGRNPGPEVVLEIPGILFPRDRGHHLHSPPNLARFLQELDTRAVLDTAHAGTTPQGVMEVYDLLKGRLANVHFSNLATLPEPLDWPYLHSFLKHHQLPSRGTLPLAQFLKALKADAYPGPLTLEFSPVALSLWWPSLAKRKLREALEFVRRELGQS